MNKRAIIKIEKREKTNSRASKQLRKTGYAPASISGKGMESVSVKVKADELNKSLSKYGRNYLFDLDLEGEKTYTAIVKKIEYSPVTRVILNVDFQHVSFNEEIKVDLEIKIVGRESIESKRLLLMQQMDKIPVKGLPQDIPDCIELDITDFNLGDKISIGDIKYPKGIEPEGESDKIVLSVNVANFKGTDEEEEKEEENL